jgi:hypothetical protein
MHHWLKRRNTRRKESCDKMLLLMMIPSFCSKINSPHVSVLRQILVIPKKINGFGLFPQAYRMTNSLLVTGACFLVGRLCAFTCIIKPFFCPGDRI